MKAEIHPPRYPAIFLDVSTGKRFFTFTAVKSKKTEDVEGVEYQVFARDITADSHPAYTGEKRFVDTAGRVEKFQSKFRGRGRSRGRG